MVSFWLVLVTSLFATVRSQQSKSADDFAAFSASLGGMDIVWIIYVIVAVLLSFCCICKYGLLNSWCQSTKYDAMTEECYGEILTARGYNAENKAMGDDRPLKLLVLRADLKEKRVWQNNWKEDFVIFLRNEHAVFSTCFSHPQHPFSRKQRRAILASVLLIDFALAMWITFAMSFGNFNNTTEFIIDYLLSYFFGILMSIMESILVSFAVCSKTEKCPTICRNCCKAMGNFILFMALCNAIFAFIIAIIVIILVSQETGESSAIFWEVFSLNFVVGVFQAWFLIDLIKMGIEFRTEWKHAHPPPPGPEREKDEEKKKSCLYKCCHCFSWIICCPICCAIKCCCSKEKRDPYDDGCDDIGINYKEFELWRNKEDVGDRTLPKKYQGISTHELKQKVSGKVDNVKQATSNKVNNTINDAKQIKTNVSAGAKSFKNKFTKKKMEMQMKLSGKKKDNNTDNDNENENIIQNTNDNQSVELVVGGNANPN